MMQHDDSGAQHPVGSDWEELETFCIHLESRRAVSIGAKGLVRFAALYRSACADLALADANRLPPATIQYLHRLVARAHNQLYRSRQFNLTNWGHILLTEVPRRIYSDRCVQLTFLLFWAVFIVSATLAADAEGWPDYVTTMMSPAAMDQLEDNFADGFQGSNARVNPLMAGFYIRHNMGIGLQCFLGGMLVIPGILITLFNAAFLGCSFGFMARPDVPAGLNFFEFVIAHGPFELTAIVLSAAAGLRLGLAWIHPQGVNRIGSLRSTANEVMPLMGAALLLFFLAALLEAFLSPSPAPFVLKAAVGLLCSGVLTAYFVILGFPRGGEDAFGSN